MKILLTGATGYVGGRLIPKLLEKGYEVRILVRDPNRIRGRSWAKKVEIAVGDVVENQGLDEACRNMDVAYYLIHSMGSGKDFEKMDQDGATHFAQAAKNAKIPLVIYLGGLIPQKHISKHLQSRAEVGKILSASLPTTEFHAGPIIGSGSASFEMLRYLTERLPVMVAPKWIKNKIQPVAIRDVLTYLVEAAKKPAAGIVDIGANALTFKEMMLEFASARNLKRWIFPVPVLAPKLASLWVGLVTPIPNTFAIPIIEGIVEPLLADTTKAQELFPDVHPISYRKAVDLALVRLEKMGNETRWSGAFLRKKDSYSVEAKEGMIREVRTRKVNATAETLFQTFVSLGGSRGWLTWNWAWKLRGVLDRIVGGPGLRRGRRHPTEAFAGEAIDFWRVEEVDPPKLIRLRAEMKVPGQAWLQWNAKADGPASVLTQTASFAPRGLGGFFYWYGLYPMHALIFSGMARAIASEAEKIQASNAEIKS